MDTIREKGDILITFYMRKKEIYRVQSYKQFEKSFFLSTLSEIDCKYTKKGIRRICWFLSIRSKYIKIVEDSLVKNATDKNINTHFKPMPNHMVCLPFYGIYLLTH